MLRTLLPVDFRLYSFIVVWIVQDLHYDKISTQLHLDLD